MSDDILVPIDHEEDIITARQKGRDLAKEIGFGIVDQSRIPTAISELARNIIRYAGSGVVRIARVSSGVRDGIEIVAEDRGPGIPDVSRALQEGYSTGGGLGMGLPGARRLMDEMEVDTEVGRGTKVTVRKWRR